MVGGEPTATIVGYIPTVEPSLTDASRSISPPKEPPCRKPPNQAKGLVLGPKTGHRPLFGISIARLSWVLFAPGVTHPRAL